MSKPLQYFCLILLVLSLFSCSRTNKKILITKWIDSPDFEDNYQGFLAGLKEKGFEEGKNLEILVNDAAGDIEKQRQDFENLKEQKFDLIFTRGSSVTELAHEIFSKKIPRVFSIVSFPQELDIWDSGSEIIGTSNHISVKEQNEVFERLSPGFKSIAFLRSKHGQPNSRIQLHEFKDYYEPKSIQVIDLVSEDVEELSEKIIEYTGNIDIIVGACDGLIQNDHNAKIIADLAFELKIPSFACNGSLVKKGFLAALVTDYFKIGKEAGIMAADLLKGSQYFSAMNMGHTLHINKKTLNHLNLGPLNSINEFGNLIIHGEPIAETKHEDENYFNIYLDSDRSNNIQSASSIEKGVKLAFKEAGNKISGVDVRFVIKDHSGNTVKVEKHLLEFINDPHALVYYAGLHSPPIIKLRDFINENNILTMVPWAAGAPITRSGDLENFIFRLSLDDAKVGRFIADYSVKNKSCKNPYLLLENTRWGESNKVSMLKAFASYGLQPKVVRFGWNMNDHAAFKMVQDVINSRADCIGLVANALESSKVAKAMLRYDATKRIPIISHWGISGGNFSSLIPYEKRQGLDLSFVQTKFSFNHPELSNFAKNIFAKLRETYPVEIKSSYDLKAAVGFIHAYDLTKLLIASSQSLDLSYDVALSRKMLKEALENKLSKPIQGLVKQYQSPFSNYDESKPDAHEALNITDYAMAKFGRNDEVILID